MYTNQFRMHLTGNLDVFIYTYTIKRTDLEIEDAYIIHKITKLIRDGLRTKLDKFVVSGQNIFTTTDLQKDIVLQPEFKQI